MSARIVPLPRPIDAAAAWRRYYAHRASVEERWPNVGVGIEDLRTLVRLYDEACAALAAEGA